MTDFYTLLKQSIIDRDVRDAGDREAIYAQAREAIVKQLWAYKPPLAADEIDTRVGAYDQAVERIERDLRVAFAGRTSARQREGPVGRRDERPVARPAPRRRDPEPPPSPPPPPEDDEPWRASGDDGYEEEAIELPAPPIADWRHEDDEDDLPAPDGPAFEEPDDLARGIPRARTTVPARRQPARYVDDADDGVAEDDGGGMRGDDADAVPSRTGAISRGEHRPLPRPRDPAPVYETAYTDDDEPPAYSRRPRNDDEPPRPHWWAALGERHAVQILAGAIAALLIALLVFGGYLLFATRGSGEAAATMSSNLAPAGDAQAGVRREVSDAATATRIASEEYAVAQSYILFDGTDPTVFASTPENPLRFASDAGFVRASSTASAPGVRAIVGPGLAERLAGKSVRINILARASPEFGAASMRFAYQSGLAVSHWQTANLTPDYQAVAMIWRLPAMRTAADGDFLLIEPGIPGDGSGVDIRAIRLDVLADQS